MTNDISVVDNGQALVVVLRGEVDATLRDQASAALSVTLRDERDVEVDATEVRFIDSSGLAFIMQLQRTVSESDRVVRLRDPAGVITNLLQLIGLPDLFEMAQ